MDFLYWVLASFGITTIVSVSKIFKPVRDFAETKSKFLGELLACSMCTGFWVGVFLSLAYYSPTGNILVFKFFTKTNLLHLRCSPLPTQHDLPRSGHLLSG